LWIELLGITIWSTSPLTDRGAMTFLPEAGANAELASFRRRSL
jgi:hypothetical protein